MWTRKEIFEFKETIKKEEGEAIIKIGHGETVTVRVPTHIDGRSLYWEFATDSYDIGFGLFFEWVDPEDTQVTVLFLIARKRRRNISQMKIILKMREMLRVVDAAFLLTVALLLVALFQFIEEIAMKKFMQVLTRTPDRVYINLSLTTHILYGAPKLCIIEFTTL